MIRFRTEPEPAVHWSGLVLPVCLELRREIQGRTRWFVQLVQEGRALHIREVGQGTVGLNLGPSAIAAVSSSDAILEPFCPTVEQPCQKLRRIERAMDRSHRATNLDNFDERGQPKKGRKPWRQSRRYRALAHQCRERKRRLAAERKRAHVELANRILGQGATIQTEDLSYRSFQRNFGRSVNVHAPGLFVSILRRKAASADAAVVELPTRTTRSSQFDHSTGAYVKKPLSQRMHVFGSGTIEPVQRDLYSAFLARSSP